MPTVTYIENDGTPHIVNAENGQSLMQAARDNLVPGILGDCGGSCSCATCHVYVDPAWIEKLPAKSEDEAFLLEGLTDVQLNSRLSCQIKMDVRLNGLVLRIPDQSGK